MDERICSLRHTSFSFFFFSFFFWFLHLYVCYLNPGGTIDWLSVCFFIIPITTDLTHSHLPAHGGGVSTSYTPSDRERKSNISSSSPSPRSGPPRVQQSPLTSNSSHPSKRTRRTRVSSDREEEKHIPAVCTCVRLSFAFVLGLFVVSLSFLFSSFFSFFFFLLSSFFLFLFSFFCFPSSPSAFLLYIYTYLYVVL